jgi:hypothetical protein
LIIKNIIQEIGMARKARDGTGIATTITAEEESMMTESNEDVMMYPNLMRASMTMMKRPLQLGHRDTIVGEILSPNLLRCLRTTGRSAVERYASQALEKSYFPGGPVQEVMEGFGIEAHLLRAMSTVMKKWT